MTAEYVLDRPTALSCPECGGTVKPERVGTLLFATVHGLAALVTSGMLDSAQLDELLADATAAFLLGSTGMRM